VITLSPMANAAQPAMGVPGAQISPALLQTLQTINQTKLVTGEREKLLMGANRLQTQKQ
jgi:hypothetical protein